MNNYDKYYRKGGDYVIPVEIFNDLLGELEELHNKIDKAIDYIEENKMKGKYSHSAGEYDNFILLEESEINDLLEILKESE